MARLPPVPEPFWRISHFWRLAPCDYSSTLLTGRNLLVEPGLAEYYEKLSLITRGRLWDSRRLAAIWSMNLGRYDRLLESARRTIRTTVRPGPKFAPDLAALLRELNRNIAAHPEEPLFYAWRGMFYAEQEETDKALDDVNRVLALDPGDAQAYNFHGAEYMHRGDLARALEDFNRAIETDPRSPMALVNRARLHLRRGEPAKALEDFGRAIDVDADDISARIERSAIYLAAGDRRRAIEDFRQIIDLLPAIPLGYHLLAGRFRRRETSGGPTSSNTMPPTELSSAFAELAWVLATHPDPACRDGGEAVRYARLATELGSEATPATPPRKTPRLLDVLAASYAEAGRFAQAVSTARQAVKLAIADGEQSLADEIGGRLRRYEAGEPYHVSPPTQ